MRRVLQAENVGPNGNPLYVLRVVRHYAGTVAVEVVDVRGAVVWLCGTYVSERAARATANALYAEFKRHNGVLAAVRGGTK